MLGDDDGSMFFPIISVAGAGSTISIVTSGSVPRKNELVINSSARRFKKNIRALPASRSEGLYDITAHLFEWRANTATPNVSDLGFIADEVVDIFPEVVVRETITTNLDELLAWDKAQQDQEETSHPVDLGPRPEAITEVGEPMSIRYDLLVVPLIQEVQKLNARIAVLEAA